MSGHLALDLEGLLKTGGFVRAPGLGYVGLHVVATILKWIGYGVHKEHIRVFGKIRFILCTPGLLHLYHYDWSIFEVYGLETQNPLRTYRGPFGDASGWRRLLQLLLHDPGATCTSIKYPEYWSVSHKRVYVDHWFGYIADPDMGPQLQSGMASDGFQDRIPILTTPSMYNGLVVLDELLFTSHALQSQAASSRTHKKQLQN